MNILRKKSSSTESRLKFPGFRRAVPNKATATVAPQNMQEPVSADGSEEANTSMERDVDAGASLGLRRDKHARLDAAMNSALLAEDHAGQYKQNGVKQTPVDEILAEPMVSGSSSGSLSSNSASNSASSSASSSASGSAGSAQSAAAGTDKSKSLVPLKIKVPDRVGKYVVGARLGSGTCGVVHRGLDDLLGREIAIKLSPSGEKVSTDKMPGAERAYQTEVYAAGRLRHPNIVTVHDAGQYEELNYIIMEVVDGNSLKAYGKGQTLLPTYRALEVICECCKALDYSHRQDILHRDIKPANIMVADDGGVKLLDFGIAVGLSDDSGLERKGPTLGTPNYMSPEQILGKTLSPASDFYSLGTVLFELLTGKQLFKAKKVKDLFRTVVHQPAPMLKEFRPDLPQALSDALDKVLSKKPERRYQSGIEMIDALSRFIEYFRIVEQRTPEQKELLQVLHTLPFFKSFSDADIARMIAHSSVRTVAQGELLITNGDASRDLMLLIDGVASVHNDTSSNGSLPTVAQPTVAQSRNAQPRNAQPRNAQPRDSLHRVYGPGECVGEMGFIHGTRETINVVARSNLRVLEISADTLAAFPPKLHLHYYKRISDTLVARMAEQQQPFTLDCDLA